MPEPLKFPRIVDEDRDSLYLRCLVDGTERECELTIGQAWAMLAIIFRWLEKASRR